MNVHIILKMQDSSLRERSRLYSVSSRQLDSLDRAVEQSDLPSRSNQVCLHGDELKRGRGSHLYLRSQNRALTNRERARLQNFHDDFKFHDSKESVRKPIGIAAPPKGAKIICEAILNTFTDIPYGTASPTLAHLVTKN